MISATLASRWSRSSVCVVAAETSSRKSSNSDLSRNRTEALRVDCMARLSGGGGLDDLHAGAGADARGPRGCHGLQIRQRANPAGSLDAHLRPHHAAPQRPIVRGGARRAETGRSLDEIRTRQFRERAGDGFLVIVQQRRLQDYLHNGLGFVRRSNHLPNIRLDGFVVTGAQLANIDHHVDFLCAVAQRDGGFRHLGFGRGGTQRETHHGANPDRRPRQLGAHQRHPVGVHAHAGEIVLARLAADLDQVGAGGFGLEYGVVDKGCDGRVDLGQPLAGGNTVGAGCNDLLSIARAGLGAALDAPRAHLVRQVEPLAFLDGRSRCGGSHPRQDLFANLSDESVEFRLVSDGSFLRYFRSISRIFCTRAWWRPPANGVAIQVRNTSSAWVWVKSRAPSVSTLESLCSRLFRAEALS